MLLLLLPIWTQKILWFKPFRLYFCMRLHKNIRDSFLNLWTQTTWAVIFAGIMFLNTVLKGGSSCQILVCSWPPLYMHINMAAAKHPSSLKWLAGSTVLAWQFLLQCHITSCMQVTLKTCTTFLATIIKRCAYYSLSMLVSQMTQPKYQLVSDSYLNKLLHYTNMFKECGLNSNTVVSREAQKSFLSVSQLPQSHAVTRTTLLIHDTMQQTSF